MLANLNYSIVAKPLLISPYDHILLLFSSPWTISYLDNTGNKANNLGKLGHIHVEVLELVLDGFACDNPASFPDRVEAPQVASGVEVWVWGLGKVDIGHLGGEGRERRVWGRSVVCACGRAVHGARTEGTCWRLDARGARVEAGVGLVGCEGGFLRLALGRLVFSREDTHGG